MKKQHFDFGGWATKNDLLCADGRTIRKDAFKDDDGRTGPLVWQHNHDDPTRVIGHALLENQDEGVFAYCSFNNSDIAQHVKELVRHEDVNSLSIYANKLKQSGGDVLHGVIREVSVVLAGANPGALIEFPIMEHGEESETEACIWPGEESLVFGDGLKLEHAEEEEKKPESETKPEVKDEIKHEAPAEKKEEDKEEEDNPDETVQDVLNTLTKEQKQVVEFLIGKALEGEDASHSIEEDEDDLFHADDEEDDEGADGKTVGDIINTLTPKQRKVVEFLIAQAIESREQGDEDESDEDVKHSDDEGEEFAMKKNVFDNDQRNDYASDTLTHDQLSTIAKDAQKLGSLKEAVLAHSQEYGIEQIDYLAPEYREVSGNGAPQFIKRDNTWVGKVMRGVHHTPFAKIKMTFADITADEARARGYIKGNRKKEEVFGLLKRVVDPTTVYKKQKIDRDDAIDIERDGFDMVAWLKSEMRMMLDEELARAYLIGDGRSSDSDDKIREDRIIPVLRDDDLFVVRKTLTPEEGQSKPDAIIDAITYAFEDYQGTGNCVAFMPRRIHSQLKLMKDKMGRRLYNNDSDIASALGVGEIIFVPQMTDETTVREDGAKTYKPLVIILDMNDYNVGADKGGSVNMFDDFDIDYNQMKYLIETRCSGALVKPYSAIVIEEEVNP